MTAIHVFIHSGSGCEALLRARLGLGRCRDNSNSLPVLTSQWGVLYNPRPLVNIIVVVKNQGD